MLFLLLKQTTESNLWEEDLVVQLAAISAMVAAEEPVHALAKEEADNPYAHRKCAKKKNGYSNINTILQSKLCLLL